MKRQSSQPKPIIETRQLTEMYRYDKAVLLATAADTETSRAN